MKLTKNLTMVFLTSLGAFYPCLSVKADVQSTTVKTTTFSGADPSSLLLEKQITTTEATPTSVLSGEVKSIVLPAGANYLIVDPLTGAIKGNYDPSRGVTDASALTPGSVVIDQSTGKIMATLSTTGQTIDVISAPALDSLVVAIDNRRSDIDRMITSGLSSGTIDTKEAAALRAELDKIATRETLARQSGRVTYSEALSIALLLNNLSDRVVLLEHGSSLSPLLASRIVNSDGSLSVVDSITYRRAQIGQRVEDEYSAGRLSAKQVSDLKEQLNSIASLDSKYRKDGQLSPGKSEKLSVKLDSVESKMTSDVATINNKRAKIGIKVQ